MKPEAGAPLERVWREEHAGLVAVLVRRLGDLDLAEDAVQDAFARATAIWARDGVPKRPGAWLTTVAWHRALELRRSTRPLASELPDELPAPVGEQPEADEISVDDDVLGLVLACCHPSLALEARVALTLRHVAGLTVEEIAAALVRAPDAVAKRLVRARRKLSDAATRFGPPTARELPQRLHAVHAVLYLLFTEGHSASDDGPPLRRELCEEAIWLAEQLQRLVPQDAETTGLLALLLLTHARADARTDQAGRLVLFADQDRDRWDHDAIERARGLLARTGFAPPGPYQLQAAIAALHASAPAGDEPDWAVIAELHRILGRMAPSPVTEVNRAMAVGRGVGARAGLRLLEGVLAEGRVDRYPGAHAVHADLLERAGDPRGARAAWERAAALSANGRQRDELLRRARAAMSSPPRTPRR